MKKFIKSTAVLLLVLALLSAMPVSLAAEKEYYDYKSYVLLGDSVASGWSDVEERETRFVRVEGSYGAFVADDLGVETYHPMACIGFRTVEMRYIFEDDFEGDRFLFYSIDDDEMERRIPEIRKAVAEADLITLNVGGNDWGSYLGWHVFEEMDKMEAENEEFFTQAEEYLKTAGADANIIDTIIDIAAVSGALPDIIKVLPGALEEGFTNFVENWNYMIEDIYALNPDVTLVVIGMFDTAVQDQETADKNEAAEVKLSLGQTIVDIANQPMREGANKYGYTFIDPIGTICEKQHPSTEGHRYIADLILASLPDAAFPYKDVDVKSKNYKAIETLCEKGIMEGVSETKFAPDEKLTKAQLSSALNKIAGVTDIAGTQGNVSRLDMASAIWDTAFAGESNVISGFKTLMFVVKMLVNDGKFNVSATLTRGEGAQILFDYMSL